MTDNCFQLKLYCSTGGWPRGAQVRARQGRSERPDSSMKRIARPCRAAIFLVPATSWPSRFGSPSRRAGAAPGRSVVARSSPAPAAAARPTAPSAVPQCAARSAGQSAARPTTRSGSLRLSRTTKMLGPPQRLEPTRPPLMLPARHGRPCDPDPARHLRLRHAGCEQPPTSSAASLPILQSPLVVHPHLECNHSMCLDSKPIEKCCSLT